MAHAIIKHPDNAIYVVHLSPSALKQYAAKGLDADQAAAAEVSKLKSRGDLPIDSTLACCNGAIPLEKDADGNVVLDEQGNPQADREFRGAWRWLTNEPKVDICPHAAAEVTRNRLRAERQPKLDALDIEYQRADEAGNAAKKAEIAARKQALRDAPETVPTVAADVLVADAAYLDQLRAVTLPE